jgi:protein TonB
MKKALLIFSFLFVQFVSAQVTDEPVVPQQSEEKENNLYPAASVEVKPEFPGGIEKFYKFVANNFNQPSDKKFKGGKIIVQFVVEKDGSITDIVVRDIGFGTKDEAMRVFSKMPNWMPGEQNGKKIRCMYTIPITLQGN